MSDQPPTPFDPDEPDGPFEPREPQVPVDPSADETRFGEPGSMPTPDEEAAAERGARDVSPESAEQYREYLEMAANVEGEGRI